MSRETSSNKTPQEMEPQKLETSSDELHSDPGMVPLLSDADRDVERNSTPRSPASNKGSHMAMLFSFMFFAYAIFLSHQSSSHIMEVCSGASEDTVKAAAKYGLCPSTAAPSVKAPRRNVWKNLDVKEATDLRRWLFDSERGLNLTRSNYAVDSDNVIHLVEAFNPAKSLALAYLSDASIEVPRYARAVVHNASTETIHDLLVGPLPISGNTTIRPLTEIYHNPSIPLNARSTFNWTILDYQLSRILDGLDDITVDLFNGSVSNKTLVPAGVGPMSYDGSFRRTWVQLRRNKPGAWLLPIDMYLYVDMSGTDPSTYRALRYVHDGKMYRTIDNLRSAWQRGELKRSHPDQDDSWATRRRHERATNFDLDDRAGPRRVAFDGARFKVDRQEDYVTWMGWSFYLGFQRDMGLRFWDINFRGERIIYELSPQEAMAQYSGFNPHQASTVWLDRAFGMGSMVREVMIGYDCPSDATLLDATVHEGGSSVRPNAICIFESERSMPLSRHVGGDVDETGAVKGYELVVRSISTVGNYDYIFDYTFQLDGTLEIRVSASGYLQGGTWTEGGEEDAYGHRLQRDSMGSLHDHVINFKFDFDILGTRNSMTAVTLETEHKQVDWLMEDEPWGNELVQQRVVRKPVAIETKLEYPVNMEGAYVITNNDHLNAWGNPRGYVIHPGPLCRLTNKDSPRTAKQVDWAKHHLAVSRRHDNEPESSSPWNMNLPGRPPVEFDKFFNGESIEQEDLVVWLNLGTHHIPRAEDSPNTLTNLATSYVLLAPHNFNDYDVSIDSRNSILLNKNKSKQSRPARETETASLGLRESSGAGSTSGQGQGQDPRSESAAAHRMAQRSNNPDPNSNPDFDSQISGYESDSADSRWEVEEDVSQRVCMPRPLEKQEYRGILSWGELGERVSMEGMGPELPHRANLIA